MATWELKNPRVNAAGNKVFDVYRLERFVATVERRPDRLAVLLGALQPAGKEAVLALYHTLKWEA